MRGWAALWQQQVTKQSNTAARDYFERAIKIDPQNADAMVGLAYARGRASFYGWSTRPRIPTPHSWTCCRRRLRSIPAMPSPIT